MKTAAAANDTPGLTEAIIKASGTQPATHTIADNAEILMKLQNLLNDIGDDKEAAQKVRGQLLILSLGALRAEKHGEDTQALTDNALQLSGF